MIISGVSSSMLILFESKTSSVSILWVFKDKIWTVGSSVGVKGIKLFFITCDSSVTVWIGKDVGRVTVVMVVIVGWLEGW